MSAGTHVYEFADFRLDGGQRLLFRSDEIVALPPKAIDLLLAILEEPGRLYTKEELLNRVWPDVVVDESNLSQNIFLLRKALGDDVNRWIATVPRRGYRFAGELNDAKITSRSAAAEIPKTTPVELPPAGPLGSPAQRSETRHPRRALAFALVGATVLAVTIGGWFATHGDRTQGSEPTRIHSIAVLPFRSIDPQHRDVALEVGVADTLINRLSLLPEVTIVPTRAVTRYATGEVDPVAAGRELKTDAVIDGNLQAEAGRVRSTVRLLRVSDGRAIWADHYDDSRGNIFDLEDHLAERIVDALHIPLNAQTRDDLVKRYTENEEAYRLYSEGHFAWSSFTQEGLMRSLRCYEAALKKDPHYALAYVGLANAYTVISIYGPLPRESSYAQARQAAERAVALDPGISDAYTALAGGKIFHDWDWKGAETKLQKAIALGPNQVNAHSLRGYVMDALGRTNDAVSEQLRARDLDPSWIVPREDLIEALFLARRYDDVIQQGLEILALDPSNGVVHYYVGRALLMKSDLSGSEKEERAAIAASTASPYNAVWVIGQLDAMRGDQKGFAEIEQRLKASAATDFQSDYCRALLCAATGHIDEAFEALDAARASRYSFLYQVRTDPAFDSLRNDPRYQSFLTSLHLGSV